MTEPGADLYRDSETIAQCARIAAQVLKRHNVDWSTAKRLGGWSNATWSAGGLVLRIAVRPGTDRLLREARLASLLPPEAGHPPIVESGVTEDLEWVLAREVAGRNLGEVWPTLCWEARLCALRQLWERARAVHSTDILQAQARASSESPLYASGPAQAAQQLARLQEAGILVSDQVAVLAKVLDRYWTALEFAPRVLCHGDLCTENALWHDGRVVALLDFEYAIVAPVELDLNELVKSVFAPPESVDPLPDPDGAGLERARQTVTEIAAATMTTPGSIDRLLGYALLLDLWAMENELSIEGGGSGAHTILSPYRALQMFADGTGGYLAPFLARLEALKGEQSD